ncbi:RNA-guided endonuclease InsQ/TnpB family protein [Ligilactobacillus faecis]|uniref:RNA-guided endonuclease InsQ/TnpB family protein n=1 Tax=Ligilactobacillus faecis TaxID=762833 RepID=UPI00246985AD|nr:transposase [Ligilactobacillus faecis]WGN89309.1 transposase [Ligilactobacillus faecis]
MIRVQKVRLYPNKTMKKVIDDLCDYRRYCWNQGLALWNDMYDNSLILEDKKLKPSERKVRDELVANKEDWQYLLSARCLQLAISDLGKAWKNFFNRSQPDWGKPKFKSKKAPRQGFKTDRAKIVAGKLRLDKPRGIKIWYDIRFKGAKNLEGELKVVSIYRENGKYWASLPFEIEIKKKIKTGKNSAVDVNVGHLNYTDGKINTLLSNLKRLYKRIKYYQRKLARKRVVNGKKATQTSNYVKTRAKLQRDYRKAASIQHDIIHKFTTELVTNYDQVVIEDLDVKKMQMTHVASKGLHRSLFGYFRQTLTYKCNWYGKKVVLADKYYPSTQRCSKCGFIKTGEDKVGLNGNEKHRTKHNEYICYECGAIMDRDENAVANLLALLN